jgi:hypothetical protein
LSLVGTPACGRWSSIQTKKSASSKPLARTHGSHTKPQLPTGQ